MTDENRDKRDYHRQLLKNAWDDYHPAYMEFHLKEKPDFHMQYARGAVTLDDWIIELAGDVKGKRLLDTCCAGDACQAFSWENLGARVTACDLSPVAIGIARQNAEKIGSRVEFVEADAQTLTPVPDEQFDLVFATYICWFEDLFLSCRSWHRVLKPGGRLLLTHGNPVTECLKIQDRVVTIERDYFDTSPEYSRFNGTPLADEHGGWQGREMIVEFFHPLAEVVNAIAQAGFCIKEMVEVADWGSDPEQGDHPEGVRRLPNELAIRAEKEVRS